MILKAIMSNGPEVPFENEEAFMAYLEQASKVGVKIVLTKFGGINPAYCVSIVKDKERNSELSEQLKYEKNKDKALENVLGSSPFAKLLSERKKMLSDSSMNGAVEETASQERKLRK